MSLRALLCMMLCAGGLHAAPAFAVYKCESNGTTTYGDAPCPGGQRMDLANPPADPEAARRLAREKQELARIQAERTKQERQDEKARIHAARAQQVEQKRCTSLAQKLRWAQEDAASAPMKSTEKAKRRARRIAESYQTMCVRS
ncbi:protein of unknown function [Noviherbaspirillum humi]|uniref:DUF4124 domain-containing protein n=1 Tax=Noviherbaspirillum humi TaxID=1688639 RepID=A0A239KS00_9BURK|nr:DUF4124 domain-containing protein [Noviherbaspirillum humi]SNT20448.1 protein of unknown function [Noviherbaspirillum humi]